MRDGLKESSERIGRLAVPARVSGSSDRGPSSRITRTQTPIGRVRVLSSVCCATSSRTLIYPSSYSTSRSWLQYTTGQDLISQIQYGEYKHFCHLA